MPASILLPTKSTPSPMATLNHAYHHRGEETRFVQFINTVHPNTVRDNSRTSHSSRKRPASPSPLPYTGWSRSEKSGRSRRSGRWLGSEDLDLDMNSTVPSSPSSLSGSGPDDNQYNSDLTPDLVSSTARHHYFSSRASEPGGAHEVTRDMTDSSSLSEYAIRSPSLHDHVANIFYQAKAPLLTSQEWVDDLDSDMDNAQYSHIENARYEPVDPVSHSHSNTTLPARPRSHHYSIASSLNLFPGGPLDHSSSSTPHHYLSRSNSSPEFTACNSPERFPDPVRYRPYHEPQRRDVPPPLVSQFSALGLDFSEADTYSSFRPRSSITPSVLAAVESASACAYADVDADGNDNPKLHPPPPTFRRMLSSVSLPILPAVASRQHDFDLDLIAHETDQTRQHLLAASEKIARVTLWLSTFENTASSSSTIGDAFEAYTLDSGSTFVSNNVPIDPLTHDCGINQYIYEPALSSPSSPYDPTMPHHYPLPPSPISPI